MEWRILVGALLLLWVIYLFAAMFMGVDPRAIFN